VVGDENNMYSSGSRLNIQKACICWDHYPGKAAWSWFSQKWPRWDLRKNCYSGEANSPVGKTGGPFPDQGRCRETLKFAGGGWSR